MLLDGKRGQVSARIQIVYNESYTSVVAVRNVGVVVLHEYTYSTLIRRVLLLIAINSLYTLPMSDPGSIPRQVAVVCGV